MPINTSHSDMNPYFDHESEEAILQALFLEPELIYQTDLRVVNFHNPEYRAIYEAMLKLYADGIQFDLKALKDTNPNIDNLTLFKITQNAVTSANIKYHAKIVKSKTFNRKCKEVVSRLTGQLGQEDFMLEVEKAVMELYEAQQTSRYHSIAELLSLIQANINEARKLSHYNIQTGFKKLNDAVIGLCPKHLWILGGYTSYGKSTLLSQIVNDICSNEARVIIFSCEDSSQDKLIRLLATKTDIPIRNIVRGQGNELRLQIAREEIESFNLSIYDDVYTLPEMDVKIKKHILKGGVDVVAIDFVQNIITAGESIYDRMSEVATKLQRIAKKHNVCILALSQVSSEEKGTIKLRGAQELASTADIVLWIDRQPDKREFNLIIRKNRPFGKTGKVHMSFNETWTGIYELEEG